VQAKQAGIWLPNQGYNSELGRGRMGRMEPGLERYLLESLLMSVRDGVAVLDSSLQPTSCNRSCVELLMADERNARLGLRETLHQLAVSALHGSERTTTWYFGSARLFPFVAADTQGQCEVAYYLLLKSNDGVESDAGSHAAAITHEQEGNGAEPSSAAKLTARERQVIELMSHGHSNTEISQLLSISIQTVKTHRKNAYGKLRARNGVQATKAYLTWRDTCERSIA
jgi:DNA-binding CsgD family transcriptional regulator